jgi:hypothetical protein
MFIVTWLFDKLGYMPKIDMEVGKVKLDTKTPEFKMWPFPVEFEVKSLAEEPILIEKPIKKVKKPALKKATTRKPKTK